MIGGANKPGAIAAGFRRGVGAVLLVLAIFAGVACADDEAENPGRRSQPIVAAMRQTPPILSQDGAVAVQASAGRAGYRIAVLSFADTCRGELLRVVRQKPFAVAQPTLIVLGDATNDMRVLVTRRTEADGDAYTRIELPDPEHADLDALRAALAGAWLNEWLHATAPTNAATPPSAAPVWLAAGLARHAARLHQAEDFDLVQTQWSRGRLPLVDQLLGFETTAAMQYPAVQAVLAAWLVGQPDLFEGLMRRLASGRAWTPTLVCEALRSNNDLAALGEAWDEWMTAQGRAIRELGVTRPGVVQTFRAQLLLYPADSDISIQDGWRGRTFAECLALPDSPALRKLAAKQAMQILAFAAGHDGTLQRVAAEYAGFLEAFAKGTPPEKLRSMLAQAEDDRRKMEQRADRGEVLREPPRDFRPAKAR